MTDTATTPKGPENGIFLPLRCGPHGGKTYIVDGDHRIICEGLAAEDAALIVARLNAHSVLVEALADIELQWLPYSDADLEAFASMRSKDCGKVPPHWAEMILAARKALALARAALNGIPQPATSTALDGGKKL